jgi:hypothetical protein
MMEHLILVAVVVLLLIIILYHGSNAEHLASTPNESFVRLYQAFNYKELVFDKSVGTTENLYYRILMPINLKSIDINVTASSAANTLKPRGVSIWSVYPGDATASTEATGIYMDAYTDPAFAFRANSPKYQHVVTVNPGEHVKMELEVPVKRIFMVINV